MINYVCSKDCEESSRIQDRVEQEVSNEKTSSVSFFASQLLKAIHLGYRISENKRDRIVSAFKENDSLIRHRFLTMIQYILFRLRYIQSTRNNLKYKVVTPGSQVHCSGSVDRQQAEDYCKRLDENNEGIRFPEEKVTDYLMGGTCSAMTFDFAHNYLEKRKAMDPEAVIELIGPHYDTSSAIFRTRQAAFNTLRKDPDQPPSDFSKAKIASMLKLHDRHIVAASEEFNLDSKKSLDQIKNIFNTFQQGVFVIRCLHPEDNSKGESYGHSLALIRDEDHRYFYDPCEGVYELDKEHEPETVHHLLAQANNNWDIPLARIYQIS
jgi:hypothetical protein